MKLVCHPDAMTPDANPLVGPVADVRGLWMAAGLSLNGFGGAGGLGRSLAGWIAGETELDLTPYRPWRFGRVHEDAAWVAELARETYRYYYLLRYPFDHDEWGRPKRVSPLHGRLQDAGAVFQVKHGWERPERFEPGRPWRRAGAGSAGVRLDAAAVARSGGRGASRRPGARRALRPQLVREDRGDRARTRVAAPRAGGREPGRRAEWAGSCTRSSSTRGVASWRDVTVVRLGDDRFRVITGAGASTAISDGSDGSRSDEAGPRRACETRARSSP